MKLPYRINKKQNNLVAYVVIGAIMLVLAVICLFSPFISFFKDVFSETMKKIYMAIGCVCTPFFAFYTCYNLLNLISPPAGIIIKKNGFYDRTMADGCVGFVPVEAIISLRIFGNKSKKYLGVKLDHDYLGQIGDSKKAKYELEVNVESGMPAIIIRECDIAIPVSELLKIMLEVYSASESAENDNDVISQRELVNDVSVIPDEDDQTSPPDFSDVLTVDKDESASETPPVAISIDNDELLTIDESEKPRIRSVEELLSHLMISKNDKNEVNDEQKNN